MTVVLSDGHQGLREALQEILAAFSGGIDWTRGVFLKPNVVFPVKPERGEITSPVLVRTLVEVLRELHGDIDIVLGEGVAVGRNAEENFQVSGFARLAQELNVPLIDLNDAQRRAVAWEFGELKLPTIAMDRVYINLPILKYSSACIISGALKNQKGLLLPAVKKEFHHHLGLQRPIAELNAAISPSLSILDCSHFFGPNVLISGDNCGEIDATACSLLGIDEPDHVRLAEDAQVFSRGFAVQGDGSNIRRVAPRPEAKESKCVGRLRLWSNPNACTGCRAVFSDMKRDVLRPGNYRAKGKLAAHSVKGAEIVMGSRPTWRREYPTVICVGSCTKRLAEDNGFIHVPGCPPTLDDFYEYLP